MVRLFVAGMIAAVALLGCSGSTPGSKTGNATLAEFGGKRITRADFESYLKFKRINPASDEQRKELQDSYVEREALALAIEKHGALDRAAIQAELNEFRKEMLISRYFEKYLAEHVTDASVQNYYNTHTQEFAESRVHVAHILVRTQRTMGDTEKQAKLTTAQAAASALKAGKDFTEVAAQYSEDAVSAKKGGDLGWVKKGAIDSGFSDKVFAMKPGETSEPFETPFGYHIVKVIEGPVDATRPLDAVSGDIRYRLRNEAKQAELGRLVSSTGGKKKES